MAADVIFSTHAAASTGFGHAARCAAIAETLLRRQAGLDIVFEGDFTPEAAVWIRQRAAIRFAEGERGRVGFYDRMDDVADPCICDTGRVADLAARCGETIVMASGIACPDLPSGIQVVGYAPGGDVAQASNRRWSLDYAPVPESLLTVRGMRRDPARAFVALGGAVGDAGIRKALAALSRLPAIKMIDVLGSPVNPVSLPADAVRADQQAMLHAGVPSVAEFLAHAGVVIASYGNLGYEAIGVGAPLCLVGQKRFQAEYAEHLAARGMCVAAGMIGEVSAESLARQIDLCRERAEDLSASCLATIDGRGIERLADMVERGHAAG